MLTLLIAAYILGAAFLLGAQLLALLRLCPSGPNTLPVPERSAFALGLGMVLMAYVILALGLLGLLSRWAVLLAVGACALAGIRQIPSLVTAAKALTTALWRGVRGPARRRALRVFLALWGLLVLLGALAPPTDTDYDGLSQHLATPKIYLRHHRIDPLWFDHHSHFPATLQMLYTAALAAGSPEAAKVIHWACAICSALVLVVVGRRFVSPAAGEWAAFALLTVPLTAWLGTVAYVDLGTVFFAALLLLGFLLWDRSRSLAHLLLAATAAGGAMATKMQGIQLFAVALLLVVVSAVLARNAGLRVLRSAGAFCAVAICLAAPWYVKTAVWTGNPVYPFAYDMFGGKYWGPNEAARYRDHQLEFGMGSPPSTDEGAQMGLLTRTFSGPRSPLNLLLAPWNLAMRPGEFDVVNLSPIYAATCVGIGPLFLAALPLVLLGRPPRAVGWSLGLLAPMWLGWLMLMQYNRYLLPAVVFAALPVGYVLAGRLPDTGLARRVPRAVAWLCGTMAISFVALHGLAAGTWRAGLGLTGRSDYLARTSECYRVSDWVNRLTPPGATIALYSEPRGFYLDREYLWADPGHSRLIPYDRVFSGDDLLREFSKLGVTHVLYRRLPRAPAIFELPVIGPPLDELRQSERIRVVGRPSTDPHYVLLAVETAWAREAAY